MTLFAKKANLAYQTNKPELIAGLYTSTCKTCDAMTAQINQYKQSGQTYQGEVVHPTSTTISSFSAAGDAKVFVSSSTAAVKVVDSSGAVVKTYPASSGGLSFSLKFSDGWKITSIQASS